MPPDRPVLNVFPTFNAMKTQAIGSRLAILFILLLGGAYRMEGQSAAPAITNAGVVITERGPHDRVWSRVSLATNELGQLNPRTTLA